MQISSACTLCPRLVASRRQVVQPRGPNPADIVIVGQAPGRIEDLEGRPFVGRSGKRLSQLLELAGIDESKVYITNVVKCFPGRQGSKDRKPAKKERAMCSETWLARELRSVNPKLVIALGEVALTYFFPDEKLSRCHGRRIAHSDGYDVVAMYHPAAADYDASLRPVLVEDFRKLREPERVATWRIVGVPHHKGHLVALDFETTELEVGGKFAPSLAEPRGVAVAERCPSGVRAWYYSIDKVAQQVQLVARHSTRVAHNAKFEYMVLARAGMPYPGFHDTKIAAYLLGYRSTGLKDLSSAVLGVKQQRFEEWDKASAEYPCADAACTLLLWERFEPALHDENLWSVYNNIEIPLIPVLGDMERRGVRVDTSKLAVIALDVAQRKAEIAAEIPVNMNSPQQVAFYLFKELGLKSVRKTDTGQDSTARDVLETLDHEAARLIREWKMLDKLEGSYLETLPLRLYPDGRVHGNFNQAGTYEDRSEAERNSPATGRLSSSGPNLQNIPHRTELGKRVRACFIPADGCVFVRMDIEQEEPRVAAMISGDDGLLARLERGDDIYVPVAKQVGGKADRFLGKTLFLAKLYGASAGKLYETCRKQGVDITRRDAIALDKWFQKEYPGISRLASTQYTALKRDGFVRTYFGRKRWIYEGANEKERGDALRKAANLPVQGTSADVMKLVMCRLARQLPDGASIVLQVHDELVIETPRGAAKEVEELCKNSVRNVLPISLPVTVETLATW